MVFKLALESISEYISFLAYLAADFQFRYVLSTVGCRGLPGLFEEAESSLLHHL